MRLKKKNISSVLEFAKYHQKEEFDDIYRIEKLRHKKKDPVILCKRKKPIRKYRKLEQLQNKL